MTLSLYQLLFCRVVISTIRNKIGTQKMQNIYYQWKKYLYGEKKN